MGGIKGLPLAPSAFLPAAPEWRPPSPPPPPPAEVSFSTGAALAKGSPMVDGNQQPRDLLQMLLAGRRDA